MFGALCPVFRRLDKLIVDSTDADSSTDRFLWCIFASLRHRMWNKCARLPISYVPQQNVHPIKGADSVSVEVKVEDLWATLQRRSRISWSIRHFLAKDAPEKVKGAAETELASRGFKIGGGGATVVIPNRSIRRDSG